MDRILFRFFVTLIIFSMPTFLNVVINVLHMPSTSTELGIINKEMFDGMKDIIPLIAYCGGIISLVLTFIDLYLFMHQDEKEISNESPKAAGIMIKNNDIVKETMINKEIQTLFFENVELRNIQESLEKRINILLHNNIVNNILKIKHDLLTIKNDYLPKIIYNFNNVSFEKRFTNSDMTDDMSIYDMTRKQLFLLEHKILEIENLRFEEESRNVKVMSRLLEKKLEINEIEKNY